MLISLLKNDNTFNKQMSTESSESRIITEDAEDADWMPFTTPIMLDDKDSKIREICVIRENPRF